MSIIVEKFLIHNHHCGEEHSHGEGAIAIDAPAGRRAHILWGIDNPAGHGKDGGRLLEVDVDRWILGQAPHRLAWEQSP